MGLVESTLKTQVVKPLVRPDSNAQLPLISLESAKYVDGSVGFVITNTDIAKNTNISSYVLKTSYSSSDNTLTYLCTDESVFTFVKDRSTSRVFCVVNRFNAPASIIRQCISTYEPIENDDIDKIGSLFKVSQTAC
jgi:hypothetical protein